MNQGTKILITVVVILLLVGAGYWIWDATQKNNSDEIVTSVSAFNQTKNADASTVNAAPGDIIVYTLSVENKTKKVYPGYVVEINISEITDLATLQDAQGANYNSTNNSLVWTPLDVPANGEFEKKFTVRIKDNLPANADNSIVAKFNNEVAINIDSNVAVTPAPQPTPTPTPKPTVASSTYKAPSTGIGEWISVVLALAFTLGIVLFRTARKLA